MEAKANAKAKASYVRVSASKARRYMELIKGKQFPDAMAILEFKSSPTSKLVQKVLVSAGANAEENHNMVKDSLYVNQAFADDGPIIKRFRPRAMGRAYKIRKRTCHMTVVLSETKPAKKKK